MAVTASTPIELVGRSTPGSPSGSRSAASGSAGR